VGVMIALVEVIGQPFSGVSLAEDVVKVGRPG
jgi:hypothetical protein